MTTKKGYRGTPVEESLFQLEQFAACCGTSPDWVIERVSAGVLLEDCPNAPGDWRFGSNDLRRALFMLSIERDFGADAALAALVADMREELFALRRRLRLLEGGAGPDDTDGETT